MDVLLHNKPRKTKIKASKGKIKFCNADADVNADAEADISRQSCETTVTTKIQVYEIESEHYSQNLFSLLDSGV